MFEITARGRWAITVEPLAAAREWRTAEPLSGNGDDVVRLKTHVSGLAMTTVTTARDASGLFVWPYAMDEGVRSLDGEPRVDGLRNGSEIRLPDGTALLRIEAEGPWTLAPIE